MKKIFVISLASVLALASCNKTATDENSQFSFVTNNPFIRAAEIGGGVQEFGFYTPDEWTISWNPVDWVTIDESQFNGKAGKQLGEYNIIQMNVAPLRKNESREVMFVVHAGGEDHVMRIIQEKPQVPNAPLKFEVAGSGNPAGGEYKFSVDKKYEITVTSTSSWIHIGEVDYEQNIVKFSVDPLPTNLESRTGAIEVRLSDGYLLGSLPIKQDGLE